MIDWLKSLRPRAYQHQWKHSHNFLGDSHQKNERKTFYVIFICALSMVLEIAFGLAFGSLALVSDGIHMSTHVLAFTITWLAYTVSRKYSDDSRFVFGTGKVGDLAAFTSAIILFMIAMIIFYDGVNRLITPTPVDYIKSIPVACFGLSVNVLSGLILGGFFGKCCGNVTEDGDDILGHGHDHGHGHSHGHQVHHYEYVVEEEIEKGTRTNGSTISNPLWNHDHSHATEGSQEHGHEHDHMHNANSEHDHSHEHINDVKNSHDHDHSHHASMVSTSDHGHAHERVHTYHDKQTSSDSCVGHHEHTIIAAQDGHDHNHDHGHDHGHSHDSHNSTEKDSSNHPVTSSLPSKHTRDNNFRAAFLHVVMDAFVSILVIIALVVASKVPSCYFLDPLSGLLGSFVVMNWAYVLAYDTIQLLLDLNPDEELTGHLLKRLEADGSMVTDLHVWRLGPGHLGSIISVEPPMNLAGMVTEEYYRQRIKGFTALSHVTIEISYKKQR